MISGPWNVPDEDLPELPEPDVEFITSGTKPQEFSDAGIKGMLMNPAYAGIADFPPLVSDKQWINSAKKIMKQDSPEQFLVNLLFLLRSTLGYIDAPQED